MVSKLDGIALKQTKFYGLTGGIGAGKSTVAQILSNLAVPVLDLDKVGHKILAENKEVKDKLLQSFGNNILKADTSINRNALAKVAFSSSENTERLNNILHPHILAYEKEWRAKQVAPFAIIEASVLIESGGVQRMDGLIVVLATIDKRKRRVLERGKQDKVAFKRIIQQQCTDEERIKVADFILHNNDDKKVLQTAVVQLYAQLTV